MARPRRRPDAGPPAVSPAALPEAPQSPAPESPESHAATDRERAADALVHLMGAWAREQLDPEDPAHARLLEWKAEEERARLAPAERAALSREAREFAERMMCEVRVVRDRGARRDDEPGAAPS